MVNEPLNDPNLMPELKDLINRINAFNVSHKEGCFLFSFMGFKKQPGTCCDNCQDELDEVDDNKTVMGVYGDLETLRILHNTLRDVIEDQVDEEGFVSF